MVPRTQMVTLNEPFNVDELLETIKEHQFTLPNYRRWR